jgi:hypothetical protein
MTTRRFDLLPHPIAAARHASTLVANEAGRAPLLAATLEVVLRTLTVLALADDLQQQRPARADGLRLACLARPMTAGQWLNLLIELSRANRALFLRELPGWLFRADGQLTDAHRHVLDALDARNRWAHPERVSTAEGAQGSRLLAGHVESVLESLVWLGPYRWLRQLDSEPTRNLTFTGKLQRLGGLIEFEATFDTDWTALLLPGALYVTRPGGDEVLEVSPFAQIVVDPRTGREHLCLLQMMTTDTMLLSSAVSGTVHRHAFAGSHDDHSIAALRGQPGRRQGNRFGATPVVAQPRSEPPRPPPQPTTTQARANAPQRRPACLAHDWQPVRERLGSVTGAVVRCHQCRAFAWATSSRKGPDAVELWRPQAPEPRRLMGARPPRLTWVTARGVEERPVERAPYLANVRGDGNRPDLVITRAGLSGPWFALAVGGDPLLVGSLEFDAIALSEHPSFSMAGRDFGFFGG